MRGLTHIGHARRGSLLRPGTQELWGAVDFSHGASPAAANTPGSESAGYHYDATPTAPWKTQTPVATPAPSEAARAPATPQPYAGSQRAYTRAVHLPAPITPPNYLDMVGVLPPLPTAAKASSPLQTLLEGLGGALAGDPTHLLAQGPQAAPEAQSGSPAAAQTPKPVLRKVADLAEGRIDHLNNAAERGGATPSLGQIDRLAGFSSNPRSAPASLLSRAEDLVAANKIGPGGTRPKQGLTYREWNESLGLHKAPDNTWLDPNDQADPAHWREKTNKLDHLRSRFGDQRVSAWTRGKGSLPLGFQGPTPGAPVAVDPRDPLGAKTLGDVTARQLAQAQANGGLRISKGGILSTPQNRQVRQNLLAAHQGVLGTNGLTGPLTDSQKQIAQLVSKRLGGVLSPRTLAIQELQEQSGQHAIDREREGNFNTLDIGYFDSGPGQLTQGPEWRSPESAAKATAEFFEGKRYGPGADIPSILDEAKGKSVAEQLQIIGNSGWATSDYANQLAATAPQVGLEHNPKAIATLQQAKQAASAAGINPTPWQGDVAGGGQDFTWVRADAKGMVDWLESAIGTQEGSAKQLRWASKLGLGSTEPWCANLVSNGLLRRGFSLAELPENLNNTGTPGYEQWAEEGKYATNIGTDLDKAKPGDILTFSGAHTATYVGNGEMISGNFSDEVEKTPVSAEGVPLSMIIRPKYKGGKVKVADGTAAGTGTTESVAGSTGSEGLAAGVPADGGSVLRGGTATPFSPVEIEAPFYASAPAASNVPGSDESAEMLRLLTEPAAPPLVRR